MFTYAALKYTFVIYSLYALIGFIPLFSMLIKPPKSRTAYIFFGIFMMFFSAFMLTTSFGMESIASDILNNKTNVSIGQKKALDDFVLYTHLIAIFISFLFGGVGVNAFSKALPPLDKDGDVTLNSTIVIQQYKLEQKSTKISIYIAILLILIALIKILIF